MLVHRRTLSRLIDPNFKVHIQAYYIILRCMIVKANLSVWLS